MSQHPVVAIPESLKDTCTDPPEMPPVTMATFGSVLMIHPIQKSLALVRSPLRR